MLVGRLTVSSSKICQKLIPSGTECKIHPNWTDVLNYVIELHNEPKGIHVYLQMTLLNQPTTSGGFAKITFESL